MIALKKAPKEGVAQKQKELDALGELLKNDPDCFFSLICGATDFFPMEIGENELTRLSRLGLVNNGVPTPNVREAVQMMFCG